jgi:hypothetical protein
VRSRGSAIITVLAVALAGCASVGGGGEPAAEQPAPEPSTPATPSTEPLRAADTSPTPAEAATAFMATEVGMPSPVAGRSTESGDTAEVPVQPGAAEEDDGGQARPPVTVVSVARGPDGWAVTSASTEQIQVAKPQPDQAVTSPVTVTGKASAFEGSVQVQVRQNVEGKDPVLGEGVVEGSGTMELGPFEGRIGFTGAKPGPGWLTFYVTSEADGQVIQATVVPVTFG